MQLGHAQSVPCVHEVGMASFVCRLWTGVENPSTFTTMQQHVSSVCKDNLIDEVLEGNLLIIEVCHKE